MTEKIKWGIVSTGWMAQKRKRDFSAKETPPCGSVNPKMLSSGGVLFSHITHYYGSHCNSDKDKMGLIKIEI